MNAYDTYYFRSQTTQLQQELLEKAEQNAETLSRIEYNQLYMIEQLDSIRGDIWLSAWF